LLIKQNEKGIVLYSVGRDGKDDGGERLSHNHFWNYGGKGFDQKNTNLGTRVYLPTLRRGAPMPLDEMHIEALKETLRLMKEGK
jgi:hypothetical protein